MQASMEPPEGLFAQCGPVVHRVRPEGSDNAPVVTLHYFGMKGRGEVARLILEEAYIPYDTVTHWVGPAWLQVKSEMPLGMLPVLDVHGGSEPFRIAQSNTIVRYLAQLTRLEGADLMERTRADMLAENATELKELKSELAADADHSTLESLIAGKAGNQKWTKLVAIVASLEQQLRQAGGGFFVGGKLTYWSL
jgi:glutathione S-transferase